jgi:hypothetical protein
MDAQQIPFPIYGKISKETTDLLIVASDYNKNKLPAEISDRNTVDQREIQTLAMLVTSRLLWVLSILLYQIAKDAGEDQIEKNDIDKDQEAIAILSKIGGYEELNLPTGLEKLLKQSHSLFIRAMRQQCFIGN